jgi:hypothetical protein
MICLLQPVDLPLSVAGALGQCCEQRRCPFLWAQRKALPASRLLEGQVDYGWGGLHLGRSHRHDIIDHGQGNVRFSLKPTSVQRWHM